MIVTFEQYTQELSYADQQTARMIGAYIKNRCHGKNNALNQKQLQGRLGA